MRVKTPHAMDKEPVKTDNVLYTLLFDNIVSTIIRLLISASKIIPKNENFTQIKVHVLSVIDAHVHVYY